jgi:hypothetical protein
LYIILQSPSQAFREAMRPWFSHAVYRAIDHILMNIEAFGGQDELTRLETLYKNLSEKEGKDFQEGVQTRMEWTIERLKELKINNIKAGAGREKRPSGSPQ